MNMKLPNFNVKDLMREAGSTISTQVSRVVQLTEEKLNLTSDKTELDSHFEALIERGEATKNLTEKIVKDTEALLVPNPGNRVEDFIFEKIEKKKPQRLSNIEYLGLDLIEAGGTFGPDGSYGAALIKTGQTEQRLGQVERDFIANTGMCFIQPLRKFLDGEMRTITKEKGILETKRLDLDACKSRVRKARSMIGQQAAERELRVAQSEFDRQAEITKLLLEGVGSTQATHLRYLHAFVESQVRYFSQCNKIMNELQKELSSLGGDGPKYEVMCVDDEIDSNRNDIQTEPLNYQRARVLCSYDAKDNLELNLIANEVIFVAECTPLNSDYMHGKQGLLKGLVPKAFLEIMDD
ncbi:CLUMA_CG020367, isoform B [Clunio marinus]|uniref:CLUMA_CG020367, isoform B n=1 Tax=Clunio marinus TaxID=568069 RepID=A0A1J1J5X3_9DIPT|nr:CLUMA_CG020367, isoform B [Clunio marinus]